MTTGRAAAGGDIPLEDFDKIAREAYAALPAAFRALTGNVVIHVADAAEPELLRDLGIGDPEMAQ